jgi:hypothetical protein
MRVVVGFVIPADAASPFMKGNEGDFSFKTIACRRSRKIETEQSNRLMSLS